MCLLNNNVVAIENFDGIFVKLILKLAFSHTTPFLRIGTFAFCLEKVSELKSAIYGRLKLW